MYVKDKCEMAVALAGLCAICRELCTADDADRPTLPPIGRVGCLQAQYAVRNYRRRCARRRKRKGV